MRRPAIIGVGHTAFGRHAASSALGLMEAATVAALANAGIRRRDIDGVLCAYSTTVPHLMLANLFSERSGIRPAYAHSVLTGGASGAAMIMLARELTLSGRCKNVLVVAGDNRLSGRSKDETTQILAQMGDAEFEAPYGASIPAYYGLLAARYMHETGLRAQDVSEFAVLMRAHAAASDGAHFRSLISVNDVLSSRPIAMPLRLLDCCPMSDGAAAIIVSAEHSVGATIIEIIGAGQATNHQHLGGIENIMDLGARASFERAMGEAHIDRSDIDYLAVYDAFDATLAILVEELGFAPRGESADRVRNGDFGPQGCIPLNTHGGLLSFGHSGAAGGMMHMVEAYRQLCGTGTRRRGARELVTALVHGEGGILSAHVSLLLQKKRVN